MQFKSLCRVLSLCVVIAFVLPLCGFGNFSGSAEAATLTWERNTTDADLKDFQVWACFSPSCIVAKVPAMLQPGTVTQPATGKPSYILDIAGKEGAAAVSARDQSLNESGLSVAVPFDQKPPAIPLNPVLQ